MPRLDSYVFVIEDDIDIQSSLIDFLTDEGFACQAASDGQKALDFLKSASDLPKLILLDLMMPGLDGFGFREVQLKDSRLSSIPTVILSAAGNLPDKAKKIGIEECLQKPIDLDQLYAVVRKYVQT